jgi:dienelactone hydrolase
MSAPLLYACIVRNVSTFTLAVCASALVLAQAPAAPMAPTPEQQAARQAMEELNRQPDSVGTGRFAAMKEEIAALPEHVIYRPRDLAGLGATKLGVVAWGNGGCSDDAASSRFHLLELASHGYLVLANGRILSGPGAPPREPRQPTAQAAPGQAPAARPASPTRAAQLTAAIDWALQENQRSGSAYFGRIDPNQVAVSGFSCGGIQALAVAADPRIKTLVLQNTGIFNDAGPAAAMSSEMNLTKEQLQKIHTSTIYILGGDTDIAYANGMDDFSRINHVPVAVANLLGVGHGGSYNKPNGGTAAQAAVHWLNWTLRGDAEAGKWFLGADCTLCQDSAWSFEAKGLK